MAERGQAIESPRLGQRIVFRDTAAETGGELLRLEVTQAARRGVPPHVHPVQEERINVVDGEIELLVGRQRRLLAAGERATVPANTAHGFRGRGPGDARLVNELRPALRIEDAFVSTFALDRSRRPPLGRLVQAALIADAHPREFILYMPLVPWRLQLAMLRPLAALGRRLGVRPPAPTPTRTDLADTHLPH